MRAAIAGTRRPAAPLLAAPGVRSGPPARALSPLTRGAPALMPGGAPSPAGVSRIGAPSLVGGLWPVGPLALPGP
eukprot:12480001-Alexandrium_andersonii.AAC.1